MCGVITIIMIIGYKKSAYFEIRKKTQDHCGFFLFKPWLKLYYDHAFGHVHLEQNL